MKHLIYAATLAMGFVCTLHGETDLALEWKLLVDEARKESGVVFPSSHTGIFDGVHTMNPKTKFLTRKDGDAARALYMASTKLFGKWAGETRARTSTTEGSDGEMMQRIRATNGDYVCLIYRPPTSNGVQGTFSVVYVDASKFIERMNPNRPQRAEQGGADQPAPAVDSNAKGQEKAKPASEGRPQ